MLVLTRAPTQSIMLGDHIQVLVLEVLGDRVQIGVKAPDAGAIRSAETRPGADTEPSSRGPDGMVILWRATNQSLLISDEIEISVLSILGERARIGVEAPSEVPVFRREIYLEIQRRKPPDLEASLLAYVFGPTDDPVDEFEADARREVAEGARRLVTS